MGSTFSGIEMGKRSIMAHTDAITTAGHNISNAGVKGYSRQRVEMKEFDPLYRPDLERLERAGQIGQGLDTQAVTRARDEMLDKRIVAEAHNEGYWETRSKYYTMIEGIYNEPDEVSVRYNMDKFWDGWQELAMNPDSSGARQAVVTRGQSLTNSIKSEWEGLTGIAKLINSDIEATVKQVNSITTQIADINREIVRVRAMGDNPNDLMDRRDLLVDDLSMLINIETDTRDKDEFMIHTDGFVLVQGGAARNFTLETEINNDGYDKVTWSDTGNEAEIKGGVLGALLELRDKDIREGVQNLDTLTVNFTGLVNDIHKVGYGANNITGQDFFTEHAIIENVNGNFDSNGDGQFDKSYIMSVQGDVAQNRQEQLGIRGTLTLSGQGGNVTVDYYPEDTVEAVINRINDSTAEVKAYLDKDNRLVLKATSSSDKANPNFVIRHLEDTGFFLTSYTGILSEAGEEGAYDYNQTDSVNYLKNRSFAIAPLPHPAAYVEVNPSLINDVRGVATAFLSNSGTINAGDARAAKEIASIRNSNVMVGRDKTLDDYFANTVTNVGLKGEQAEAMLTSERSIMQDLRDLRQEISGVNIDEELSDILKFQHGYNAAAKFVTIWDSLIDTVINRLGV